MIRTLCNTLNDIGFIINEVGFDKDGHKVSITHYRKLMTLLYQEFPFSRTKLRLEKYSRYRDNGVTLYFGFGFRGSNEKIKVRFSPEVNEIEINKLSIPLNIITNSDIVNYRGIPSFRHPNEVTLDELLVSLNDIIEDAIEFKNALLTRFSFHKEFPESKNHPIKYYLTENHNIISLEYNGRLEKELDKLSYIYNNMSHNNDKNIKYKDIEYSIIDDSLLINRDNTKFRLSFACNANISAKTISTITDVQYDYIGSIYLTNYSIPDIVGLQLAKKYISEYYSEKEIRTINSCTLSDIIYDDRAKRYKKQLQYKMTDIDRVRFENIEKVYGISKNILPIPMLTSTVFQRITSKLYQYTASEINESVKELLKTFNVEFTDEFRIESGILFKFKATQDKGIELYYDKMPMHSILYLDSIVYIAAYIIFEIRRKGNLSNEEI